MVNTLMMTVKSRSRSEMHYALILKLLTTLQKSFLTHKLFLGEALHLDCPVQRSDYACVNAKECPITFPIDMSNRFFCPLEEERCCRK